MAESKKVKQAAPKAKPVVKKEPIDVDAALAELDELIGLDEVKKEIHAKVNQINNFNQRRAQGLKVPKMTNHMVFTGNPGTGKTTVARIVSKIYTALGVISGNDLEDSLLEVQRNNLVAGYVGQTARQTQEAIDKAMGGILFIDEAYSLAPKGGGTDFGQEAIDTLLIGMENNRDNLVVIAAGYENEMERFINSNPGLESRFKNFIHFADYNGEELFKIFELQLKKNDYVLAPDAEAKLKSYLNKLYENRDRNFANGRDVRNLFEEIIERQASRLAKVSNPSREDLATLTMEDMYF
jgi:SpoVK/Ycf46/Vps4 family AAA+-type ATPase